MLTFRFVLSALPLYINYNFLELRNYFFFEISNSFKQMHAYKPRFNQYFSLNNNLIQISKKVSLFPVEYKECNKKLYIDSFIKSYIKMKQTRSNL